MVFAQVQISGTEIKDTVTWFTQHAGIGWTVVLLLVLGFAVFVWRWHLPLRKAVLVSARAKVDAAEMDKQLSKELYEQAIIGLDIRDKQVTKVVPPDMAGFVRVQRDYATWYGRNRYVAEQLKSRYPDEAERFIRHGRADLQVQVHTDPMQFQLNQLVALMHVRIEALRKLAKTVHDGASSKP